MDELSCSTRELKDGYVEMAIGQGFVPVSHLTLTFDPGRGRAAVSRDGALWWWRFLVRRLNETAGGANYRRKWGHSYFGYVVGVEHHKSGAVHMHAVVDNWIDFELVHRIWQEYCGYAWIRQVKDDPVQALRYVLKYVVKEDARPTWWFQRRRREVSGGPLGEVSLGCSATRQRSRADPVKGGVVLATRGALQGRRP